MSSLDVRILGQVAVSVDGGASEISGVKPRSVLTMLVINRNRVVTLDALTEAVWDSKPPASATASLQVFISGLRKALRDRASLLVTVGRGYRLDLDDVDSDVGRFDSARRRAVKLVESSRYDQASIEFQKALSEFRGDAVADLRGLRFADDFAVAIEEERVAVQSGLYDAEIAAGRASSVVGDLKRLVTAHPLREPLWAQLITALYVSGRQADALDSCRELRRALADELGIDPSPALQQLEQSVLRQEPLATPEARPNALQFQKTETDAGRGMKIPPGALVCADGTKYVVAGETRLGRLPSNDISLDDVKVSREHAVISATVTGFSVRDLQSSNGTYVQGRRVDGSAMLSDGDELTVGRTTFTFQAPTPAAPNRPA